MALLSWAAMALGQGLRGVDCLDDLPPVVVGAGLRLLPLAASLQQLLYVRRIP